jgi:hypothetical protein
MLRGYRPCSNGHVKNIVGGTNTRDHERHPSCHVCRWMHQTVTANDACMSTCGELGAGSGCACDVFVGF